MIEAGAAFVAWVGASLVVLADGRRGLALGAALATAGLAAVVLDHGGAVEAGVLALGGAAAAGGRLLSGAAGWRIMPAGTTPRFVTCVAVALIAAWFALVVTTGGGAGLRFAAVAVLGLSGARVISSAEPDVLLTAVALLALAIAAAAGFSAVAQGLWPYLAAALIAAGVCWVPVRRANAA
ncbi:MAG TPA: hypothetical protein VJP81_04380 [Candidatus Dormibacteraeota bacterium]|nr:hypothetical protein [Candidatus Dormibacteraeota bacterium]